MTEKPKMTPPQYIETQMRIIEMGRIADSLDLETFLICIANARTVAPLTDPRLYIRAAANIDAIEKLAILALKLKYEYANVYKAVMETAAKEFMRGQP